MPLITISGSSPETSVTYFSKNSSIEIFKNLLISNTLIGVIFISPLYSQHFSQSEQFKFAFDFKFKIFFNTSSSILYLYYLNTNNVNPIYNIYSDKYTAPFDLFILFFGGIIGNSASNKVPQNSIIISIL